MDTFKYCTAFSFSKHYREPQRTVTASLGIHTLISTHGKTEIMELFGISQHPKFQRQICNGMKKYLGQTF